MLFPARASFLCLFALLALHISCSNNDNNSTPSNNCQGSACKDASPDTPDANTDTLPDAGDAKDRLLALPERAAWEFEGLDGDVQVVYTELGVPHVYATTRKDLGYVLGFVVARDRFFVMDLQRRLAQGRLSELLGDRALANDLESRQMGMPAVTQRVLEGLTPEDEAYLDAYVRGINEYIKRTVAGETPIPSELKALGGTIGKPKPEDSMIPFTRKDVAGMIAVIMYETNFDGGDVARAARDARLDGFFDDAAFAQLRNEGAREDIWNNLRTIFDDASAPAFDVTTGSSGPSASLKPLSPGPVHPLGKQGVRLRTDATMLERSAARLERMSKILGRKEIENFGSNTWAVASSHTKSKGAIVAGDGHLPLSAPPLMYQIGMDTKLFGQGDIEEAGLLITALPVLAVGTNGKVAWSQVNPVADITDWYREEIKLGADGLPATSLFQGEDKPMSSVDESFEIANVPVLGSEGRTETWARYTTFDGRYLHDIEGREVTEDEELAEGEGVVNIGGALIVPADMDGDGKITGISFDYTAFDTTGYMTALVGFTKAQDVFEYQEASKGLIGNMLYSAVVDQKGNALFTSYQAVPCRTYLPKDENNQWVTGANPTQLIDGTQYGGFTIPSLADGKVDESQAADPYKCVVPFDQTPQVINPDSGFVVNANNQPAPITNDGDLFNEPWYIGGPWSSFRANTITRELEKSTANKDATIEDMARIQGNTESRTAEVFLPTMLASIERARALSEGDAPSEAHEQRLVALYNTNKSKFDEVERRLKAWMMRDRPASSGVETFYHTLYDGELDDAVATTLFNTWLPRFIGGVFGDERAQTGTDAQGNPIVSGLPYRFSSIRMQFRALHRFLVARDANDDTLASHNPETGEAVFFDVLGTPEVERSDEVILKALEGALAFLESEPVEAGVGGFGSTDMNTYIWGLRHQVRFESLLADFLGGGQFDFIIDRFAITTKRLPLAEDLSDDDPRRGIKWFPRPGDNYNVDAANPGFSGTRFTHGSGPVMRMVIELKDGKVSGQNIVPGGQSGLNTSPHFDDQAKLWLGNETIPFRYHPEDVAAGGVDREAFTPAGDN